MALVSVPCVLLLLAGVVINECVALKSTPPAAKTKGQPWPMPSVYATTGDTMLVTSSAFKFAAGDKTCDILQDAFDRYFGYIFYSGRRHLKSDSLRSVARKAGQPMLTTLRVDVTTECDRLYPSIDMDESCESQQLLDQ